MRRQGLHSRHNRVEERMATRVLIVEYEPNIVESLRFLLRRAGYDAVSVLDGEAALAKLRMRPPDLMILYLMLPGRNDHGPGACFRVALARWGDE
jgi:CheY-like chemotaxis protein